MTDTLTLTPCQSLALRRLVDAMKADDSIFAAAPDDVRSAVADILMPPHTTAEQQIADLEKWRAEDLKLLERFGARIRDLETKLARRASA